MTTIKSKKRNLKAKAKMALLGIKGKDIAKKKRVNPSMISRVLHGRSTSRRIERAIADAVNVPVNKLFPRRKAA